MDKSHSSADTPTMFEPPLSDTQSDAHRTPDSELRDEPLLVMEDMSCQTGENPVHSDIHRAAPRHRGHVLSDR